MAFNYPLSEYKQDWKYSVCTVACKNDRNDSSINQMKASQVIDLTHICRVITHNIADLLRTVVAVKYDDIPSTSENVISKAF